jgi:hypothetical protein
MDDRSLRAYSNWNFEENGSMDYFNLPSSGNGEKFVNSIPTEMRYETLIRKEKETICE